MKIEGKTAVVIGGTQGMGAACVEALLEKGAKVCFGDILVEKGQEKSQEWSTKYGQERVNFQQCSITQQDEIEGLFKTAEDSMGPVEILFNCAGTIEELNWNKCIDVNIKGNIYCVTTALSHMGKDRGGKGGVIVLMSSISGLQPEFWAPVYSASKHAVIAYARSWAAPENFKDHGVRLNCLCPTTVNTPFLYSQAIDGAEQKILPQHAETIAQKMQTFAVSGLRPSIAGDGLIRLVEDDSLNGQAMRLTEAYGIDFAQYQDTPPQ